jgi:hypothetical protein
MDREPRLLASKLSSLHDFHPKNLIRSTLALYLPSAHARLRVSAMSRTAFAIGAPYERGLFIGHYCTRAGCRIFGLRADT